MRTAIMIAAIVVAGCGTPRSAGPAAKAVCIIKPEGEGPSATWVFAITNKNDRTLKIAALEYASSAGEFTPVGGMAEIAHSTKEGQTTIQPDGEINIVHPMTGDRLRMRLTFVLDGSDLRYTCVYETP